MGRKDIAELVEFYETFNWESEKLTLATYRDTRNAILLLSKIVTLFDQLPEANLEDFIDDVNREIEPDE